MINIVDTIKYYLFLDPKLFKILAYISFTLTIVALFLFKSYRDIKKLREIETITKVIPEITIKKRKANRTIYLDILIIEGTINGFILLITGNVTIFIISMFILDFIIDNVKSKLNIKDATIKSLLNTK